MSKKIALTTKPTAKPIAGAEGADAWVENRASEEADVAMKRLTIDIPASLHRTIKAQCAMRGTKIADEVRELLLVKYGKS